MSCNSRSFLQQQAFFFYFRDHSAPHTPQSSKATKYPSQATLRSAGYSGHHSTAIYLTDGCCPLIPMMSALLEMNTIESVTMTKCTCVYPSVAKAESSIFCSLIFNTFFWKKMRHQQKNEGAVAFPGLKPSCFFSLWGPWWIQGNNALSEDFAIQRPSSYEA